MKKWGSLTVCLVLCLSAGWIGSLAGSGPSRWYNALNKPPWNPPSVVFGPVWTVLYILMAVAVWRIWLAPKTPGRTIGLVAFGLQLVLNAAWSWAFFGAKSLGLALGGLFLLLTTVAYCWAFFRRIDDVSGRLLIPYLLWLMFALSLNAAIFQMNRTPPRPIEGALPSGNV